MAKKPVLTDDAHLHDKEPEYVYRVHHGLDPQTGEPLQGNAEPADDECGCAHCVSHVEGDKTVLAEAKTAFAEGGAAQKAKVSKRRK